jgi:hypothetical protein
MLLSVIDTPYILHSSFKLKLLKIDENPCQSPEIEIFNLKSAGAKLFCVLVQGVF